VKVADTRPAGLRANYTDVSAVEKYEMPPDEYESRTDSVLHWKKTHQLGRFDPDAPSIEQQKVAGVEREIEERGMSSTWV
jgi:tubulin-folding cofactor B